MEAKLEAVLKTVTQLSKRLDSIENKFTKFENKLCELDKKFDSKNIRN